MNRPEEQIQKAIVRFLGHALPLDAFVFAVPNQRGTRKKFEMGILKSLGVRAGVPDLIILYRQKFIGLEVKAPGNSLSPEQKVARDAIVRAGGIYELVRSVEEVERFLRKWELPIRATVLPEVLAA